MNPILFFSVILSYFAALIIISRITAGKADAATYFLGNKQSPWYLVAFGMLSDSLSGVTYISVPGAVAVQAMTYFQVVIGYFLGYFIIMYVLLPIYYRLELVSIYAYLRQRFGKNAQKTGSFFFLISRLLGAGGRLTLAIGVMQIFIFDAYGIHFALTASVFIALMLVYTYKGGIKTLVYTDAFQSLFLITGVVLSIAAIGSQLDLGFGGIIRKVSGSSLSRLAETDVMKGNFWLKHIIGGAFITVAMTGLDQNMMQKNLSMKSLGEARKNMFWFSLVMVITNLLFLSLGVLLYEYAASKGIVLPESSDAVFPTLALSAFGTVTALAFIIGLTAATFSSADSVLATLTTSFCIDFLDFGSNAKYSEEQQTRIRHTVHIGFAVLLLIVIILIRVFFSNKASIDLILGMAGLTYGPLIGLFAAGLFTKLNYNDRLIPLICLISPVITYFLQSHGKEWFGGYAFGNELILINGFLTFIFLVLLNFKTQTKSL